MSRIYSKKIEIDSIKVKELFNKRAASEENSLNAVMLQPSSSSLPMERDTHEKLNLLPKLNLSSKILELGCGAGRLAAHYSNDGHTYLGVDFSEELIEKAKITFSNDRVHFQVGDVVSLQDGELLIGPPFDLIIITALMLYLNDSAVNSVLQKVSERVASSSIIYIRETVSIIGERLTLKEFYSDNIKSEYSAIYRTRDEQLELFDRHLVSKGFCLMETGEAFPNSLKNQNETSQFYFIYKRV